MGEISFQRVKSNNDEKLFIIGTKFLTDIEVRVIFH